MKYIFTFLSICSCWLAGCSPKLSADQNWKDKKWVLIELKEVPVQLSGTNRDAHLFFNPDDKRITGSGGCNRINSSYELAKKNVIKFGEVTATKMYCPDIEFEQTFLNLLRDVDHYAVENDQLLLKQGSRVLMKLK